ncbi:MAG: hypothetical protein IPP94_19855 [Ignavibacteria bacterium]|nr:hypothetical protein [Ignavibacteria bacterium]
MRFSIVRDGRHYLKEAFITVPWTNKELVLSTSVFRDKMLPGTKEEWRLTVKGGKAETVAAELVATMYDASLDAIDRNDWATFTNPMLRGSRMQMAGAGVLSASNYDFKLNSSLPTFNLAYPRLNLFLLDNGRGRYREIGNTTVGSMMYTRGGRGGPIVDLNATSSRETISALTAGVMNEPVPGAAEQQPKEDLSGVKARTNFNETAFFFPQLRTDESGGITLAFTMPEALTRWRFMAFAHTPDMKTGMLRSSPSRRRNSWWCRTPRASCAKATSSSSRSRSPTSPTATSPAPRSSRSSTR